MYFPPRNLPSPEKRNILFMDMMVTFMYQLECPGIWLNVMLDVSVMAFLDDINICISRGRLSKAGCLPQGQWALSNPLKA